MRLKHFVSAFLLIFITCFGFTQTMEVHHLDVGQGDATLIIGPNKTVVLIDAGDNYKGDNIILPYLNKLNIHKIDYLITTHMHADHIGGADEVLDSSVKVGKVWDNGSSSASNSYKDYVAAANKYAGGRFAMKPGETIDLGSGAQIICIICNGKTSDKSINVKNENDKSVGLLISYDNFSEFIGGDMGSGSGGQADVEGFIQEMIGDLDVLKLSHHGSTTSTGQQYINYVKPEVAVISVGDNKYGHPKLEVVSRLASRNIDVLQTGAGVNPSGKILGHIKILVKKGKKYVINGMRHFKDDFIKDSNKAPIANFTYSVNGKSVTFNGLSSWDDKGISNYFWNFGDSQSVSGKRYQQPSHTYLDSGSYSVSLTVLDKYGIASSITKQVVLSDPSQDIKISASANPVNPKVNTQVTVNCSVTDGNGKAISGASITTVAHFESANFTRSGITGSDGRASTSYLAVNGSAGYRVVVDVTATYNGKKATTTTSFTPEANLSNTIKVSAYASPSNPKKYTHVKIYCTVKDGNGNPVSGASIKTVAHYKTTNTTQYGTTDSDGKAAIDYSIANATAGYRVVVDVTATCNGKMATTSTSFTARS